jgi:rhodanese-related sulfurtransferase
VSALKLGYTQVFIMAAGIKGWKEAGLPTETAPKG